MRANRSRYVRPKEKVPQLSNLKLVAPAPTLRLRRLRTIRENIDRVFRIYKRKSLRVALALRAERP